LYIVYGNHQFEYRLGVQAEKVLKARGQFNKHFRVKYKNKETKAGALSHQTLQNVDADITLVFVNILVPVSTCHKCSV
jgi:hypothetical protein